MDTRNKKSVDFSPKESLQNEYNPKGIYHKKSPSGRIFEDQLTTPKIQSHFNFQQRTPKNSDSEVIRSRKKNDMLIPEENTLKQSPSKKNEDTINFRIEISPSKKNEESHIIEIPQEKEITNKINTNEVNIPQEVIIDLDQQRNQNEWTCASKDCLIYFSQLFIITIILVFSIVNLSLSPTSASSNIWSSLIGACLGYVIPAPSLKKDKKEK